MEACLASTHAGGPRPNSAPVGRAHMMQELASRVRLLVVGCVNINRGLRVQGLA